LKILSITTLYPNAERPTFGVFVENRLRKLSEASGVDLRVVAPVPWFPFGHKIFGRYGRHGRVPFAEHRHGIDVTHPRYLQIPKIGTHLSPFLLYHALRRHVEETILPSGDIDLIDAHVYYPDGLAAAWLAQRLKKPVTVTARGTDLNLYPRRYPLIGRMIAKAAREVNASITVCSALKQALIELGAEPADVHVLRNGVDLALFRPTDRQAVRCQWNIRTKTLLSVGHLIERKGHDLVIRAIQHLGNVDLIVAGDGPQRKSLERLAARLGLTDRVRFVGVVDHQTLPSLYGAADALVLASSREGWPNVLLEALACGTPVIATRNWGTPEIIKSAEAGLLVNERTPEALTKAIKQLLGAPPARAATRIFAEGFSWKATTEGQLGLFSSLLAQDESHLAA